jgi:hypothetical protein
MDGTARQAGNASGFVDTEDTPAGMQRKGDGLEIRGMRAVGSIYSGRGAGQRAGEGGRIGQAGASWAWTTGDRLQACAEGGERGVDVCLRREGTAAPCEQCRKGPARGEEDRQLRQASAGEEALSFRLPCTCQPGRPRCQRRRTVLQPCRPSALQRR